jgi:hypothetical protein
MKLSKLKTSICLAAVLTLLFAPLALEIAQGGNAYAGILFSGDNGGRDSSSDSVSGGSFSGTETPAAHAPEPATMLLFGAGAAGLVAYKKYKDKKK